MIIEAQKPAEGILRVNSENQHWDVYHIECECTDPDHVIDVHIDILRETPDDEYVVLEIFSNLYTPWQLSYSKKYGGWGFFTRLKYAAKLLFKGHISISHSLVLKDQAALNVGQALVDSVRKHQVKLNGTVAGRD